MKKIAVVGVTGVVGRVFLEEIEKQNLLGNEFVFYASKKSAGRKVCLGGKKSKIQALDEEILSKNFDYAVFCTRETVSKEFVPKLAKNGCKVIDFSAYYRKKNPLIVPEINADKAKGNILCNPNCSTIAGVMALYEIYKKFGLKRIVYSTYQAVSGAGKDALDDYHKKRVKNLKSFKFPIFNNLIPYIGDIAKNGYSKEENKMIYETHKILGDFKINVTATCVRVPVDICHSESINFETEKKCTAKQIVNVLKNTKGVQVLDEFPNFPMPKIVRGRKKVFVGRIRRDFSHENSFNIFVVSDNLRKGAAQNGAQILKLLMERDESL